MFIDITDGGIDFVVFFFSFCVVALVLEGLNGLVIDLCWFIGFGYWYMGG